MDKVLSARVDESVLETLGMLARRLNTTKKAILERAILALAEQVHHEKQLDVLEETFGAWQRRESVGQTVDHARATFQDAMERHQR